MPILGRSDVFYRASIVVIALIVFLTPILHTLKLMRISVAIPASMLYVGLPLTTCLLAGSFLSSVGTRKVYIDWFEILLFAVASWAVFWTVWNGGGVFDSVGNLSRVALSFLLYHTTRTYSHVWTLGRTIRLGWVGASGVFIGVLILYLLGVYGPFPVYVGLSSESALLMVAVALTGCLKRSRLTLAILVLLLFLAGKRGNILAMVFMIAAAWIFFRGSLRWVVIRSAYVLGFALATAILFALFLMSDMAQVLPQGLVGRFLVLSQFELSADTLRTVTQGRSLEVIAVLAQWLNEPARFWLGSGFGGTFLLEGPDGYVEKSTVHITPLAIMFLYGLPVGLILLTAISWKVLKPFLLFSYRSNLVSRVWALTALGIFLVSMSAFVLFQNYLFWIALGLLARPRFDSGEFIEAYRHVRKR